MAVPVALADIRICVALRMEEMLPLTKDVPESSIPGARPAVEGTVKMADPLVREPPAMA